MSGNEMEQAGLGIQTSVLDRLGDFLKAAGSDELAQPKGHPLTAERVRALPDPVVGRILIGVSFWNDPDFARTQEVVNPLEILPFGEELHALGSEFASIGATMAESVTDLSQ